MWGAEAIVIVGGTAILAAMGMDKRVFCEGCNQWCSATFNAVRLGIPEDANAMDDLSPENIAPLAALRTPRQSDGTFLRVDLWKCGSCNDTAALQAKTCTVTVDSKGKEEEKVEDLTQIWLVAPTDAETIRNPSSRPPEPPTAIADDVASDEDEDEDEVDA